MSVYEKALWIMARDAEKPVDSYYDYRQGIHC